MPYSTCCGAYTDMEEIGLCPECLEHCDFEDEDEDEIEEDTKANDEVDEIALREAEEKLHNQKTNKNESIKHLSRRHQMEASTN